MTTTLSVRIDTDTKKRLEALAKRARRSKSFLAAEAIAAFVEAESWQLDEIQEESQSSMTAAVSRTRMSRTGFVRGVASENGRRLGCEHRLVATGDRAPCASSRIHCAGQPEGGQSSRCGHAGCGRASRRATESGPSWSSRRDAGTGREGCPVCDSLQTARRPSRDPRNLPRPSEMAEAPVSDPVARAQHGRF